MEKTIADFEAFYNANPGGALAYYKGYVSAANNVIIDYIRNYNADKTATWFFDWALREANALEYFNREFERITG